MVSVRDVTDSRVTVPVVFRGYRAVCPSREAVPFKCLFVEGCGSPRISVRRGRWFPLNIRSGI